MYSDGIGGWLSAPGRRVEVFSLPRKPGRGQSLTDRGWGVRAVPGYSATRRGSSAVTYLLHREGLAAGVFFVPAGVLSRGVAGGVLIVILRRVCSVGGRLPPRGGSVAGGLMPPLAGVVLSV